MEQKVESQVTASAWVQPSFEIIGVSLECTAYAGAKEFDD